MPSARWPLAFSVCVLMLSAYCAAVDNGKFYLITDFHIDPYYEASYNPDTRCRNDTFWHKHGPSEDEIDFPQAYYLNRPSNAEHWAAIQPPPAKDWVIPNYHYGQYDCDGPIALTEATLRQMKDILPNPDFLLFTGDMSAHHLPTWYTRTVSITDGFELIAQHFPDSPLYPTLGNNDFFPDYLIRIEEKGRPNKWLENIWDIWSTTTAVPADQRDNFTYGGYYSAPLSNNTIVISLNTIVLCPCRLPDDDDTGYVADPLGQMEWFNRTMAAAADTGSSVYIIGHISPSASNWYASYYHEFLLVLKAHPDIVQAQFYAHNHYDDFYLLWDDNSVSGGNQPLGAYVKSPSVTPKDGNNPSFRLVSYDRTTFHTMDYWQYYVDLLLVQATGHLEYKLEYQFTELYEQEFYDTYGIEGAIGQIARNRMAYNHWHANKHTQYVKPDDIMDDVCKMRETTDSGYWRCMLQGLPWVLKVEGVTPEDLRDEFIFDTTSRKIAASMRTRDEDAEVKKDVSEEELQVVREEMLRFITA